MARARSYTRPARRPDQHHRVGQPVYNPSTALIHFRRSKRKSNPRVVTQRPHVEPLSLIAARQATPSRTWTRSARFARGAPPWMEDRIKRDAFLCTVEEPDERGNLPRNGGSVSCWAEHQRHAANRVNMTIPDSNCPRLGSWKSVQGRHLQTPHAHLSLPHRSRNGISGSSCRQKKKTVIRATIAPKRLSGGLSWPNERRKQQPHTHPARPTPPASFRPQRFTNGCLVPIDYVKQPSRTPVFDACLSGFSPCTVPRPRHPADVHLTFKLTRPPTLSASTLELPSEKPG